MANGLVFLKKGVNEYSLEELLSSEAEVLGKGTFCSTYKAFLKNGDIVSVKRFKENFALGIDKEKVEVLGNIVHENLLSLIAYHYTKHQTLLLCDYMPNGSLFTLLHGSQGINKTPLGWKSRRNIAYGVACGLEYLHCDGPNICHGNIKSSNIFLDNFYNASLSEFGIAQLVNSEPRTKIVGGYCGPEVKHAHEVSLEADVYGFGVVVLELLTGKEPINSEEVELVKWVRLMFEEKPIIEVFDDEMVKDESNMEQMVQMLQLAICCTFEYPCKRPSMAVVKRRIKEIRGFRQ